MEEKRFAEEKDLGKLEYQNVPAEMGLQMGAAKVRSTVNPHLPKDADRIAPSYSTGRQILVNAETGKPFTITNDSPVEVGISQIVYREATKEEIEAGKKRGEESLKRLEEMMSKSEKPSNPKDIIGSGKLPLHLFPSTAIAGGCLAFLEGMLKYGRGNFRVVGVRASIYIDACERHMKAFAEGEDIDPESGLEHLWKALACIAILIDAKEANKLNDDRSVTGGYQGMTKRLEPFVAALKERHKDKSPRHYSIQDNPKGDL